VVEQPQITIPHEDHHNYGWFTGISIENDHMVLLIIRRWFFVSAEHRSIVELSNSGMH